MVVAYEQGAQAGDRGRFRLGDGGLAQAIFGRIRASKKRPPRDGLMFLLQIITSWMPHRAGCTILPLFLYNGVHYESDIGLRQQSAVRRCTRIHRDSCFGQYLTLHVRRRSNGHNPCDLPEDVFRLCAIGQDNLRGGGLGKTPRYLEDPYIVWATIKGDILWNGNCTRLLVEAGRES